MSIIPTDEDHPDFTRPSQFTAAAILAVTDTATAAPKTLGTFYTGGFESMLVRTSGQAAGVGWVYTFEWFADQGLTVPTGQLNLRTLSAITVNAQVPNRGPWCRVKVSTTSGVAHGFTIAVLPRAGTPSGAGAFLDGLIHGGFGQVVAGGGTNFVQQGFGLTPGQATLTVRASGTAWRASVIGLDELSAQVGVFGGLNSTGGNSQSAIVTLPPYWTQLAIRNDDAGNQTFDWAVQAAL